ncbi:MAG: class I SAM-dependent methyltransferase [Nocardiopsaceae bacterium]|nr:class I SAM-dependent methyltransferase [Nocardiopsaceae bacterium]
MAESEGSPESEDTNVAVWKSDLGVNFWRSTAADRERRRGAHRALMAELLPFGRDEEFTFVDLGAGTGAASRAVMDYFPKASAVLADFSPQMMEQGAADLAPYEGRYRYVEFDLAKSGRWPDGIPDPAQAVIASLAVHHLNDERKRRLFGEIFDRLAPGGWFLNYDPVKPPDPVTEEAWLRAGDRRDPDAAHKRAHRTAEEHLRYENHVRYMIPLEPQVGFLRAAGFEGVDVYWKELDYVIYGGRRPPVTRSM